MAGALHGQFALLMGQLGLAALLGAHDAAFLPFALGELAGGMGRHVVHAGSMRFA